MYCVNMITSPQLVITDGTSRHMKDLRPLLGSRESISADVVVGSNSGCNASSESDGLFEPNYSVSIAQSAGAVEYTDCTSAEG